MKLGFPILIIFFLFGCKSSTNVLKSIFVTDATPTDTDDPAIWIHPDDPMQSLILGTDKGDANGGIFVFDLNGKLLKNKSLTDLPRPNNIDVEYGFVLNGDTIDIAVFTQRNGDNLRVLRVPEMAYIDGGGIPAFQGDSIQAPMGIALYKKPTTGQIYAIVSRKSGPDGSYLWQYLLKDSSGVVVAEPVRKFGAFKGGKEIESVAADDELGFLYYADEGAGVHQYHADPDSSNAELALFATTGFAEDHEGISIYKTGERSGYILVSDQQANRFHVFNRENPRQELAVIPVSTNESDGSEVTNVALGDLYPKGFFVAMSDNRTFQIYKWEQLEAMILKVGQTHQN